MRELHRRELLLGGVALGAIGLGVATIATRKKTLGAIGGPPPNGPVSDHVDILDWTFPDAKMGDLRCAVMVPRGASGRLPLLVALHGKGETTDARTGAFAWIERYGLLEAFAALRRPPLTAAHFQSLVRPERLQALNHDLEARPIRGLVVACPSVPRDLGGAMYDDYASFLGDRLLPKLRAETPIDGTTATTGIDGVSLGGITALRIGMMRPELFGAVAAMQPAILDAPAEGHIRDPIAAKLGGRPLRLMTSDDDVYRPSVLATSQWLRDHGVAHEFLQTPGPHDVTFCRGPGALEMLAWHDRVLHDRG